MVTAVESLIPARITVTGETRECICVRHERRFATEGSLVIHLRELVSVRLKFDIRLPPESAGSILGKKFILYSV